MINSNKPNTIETKPFYTRQEVKQMLGISYPTLNKLNKTGELKAYKLGRKVFYKLVDIENSLTHLGGGDR